MCRYADKSAFSIVFSPSSCEKYGHNSNNLCSESDSGNPAQRGPEQGIWSRWAGVKQVHSEEGEELS
jgi:hypothetical protein